MKLTEDGCKELVFLVGDDSRSRRNKMKIMKNSVNKFDQETKKRGKHETI